MDSNVKELYQMKANEYSFDVPVQKTRITSQAWWWLLENFGLSEQNVIKLNKLGFVIAGGAAACMLDISNGQEVVCHPGDIDIFYKGITDSYGLAKRNLDDSKKTRSEALSEVLIEAGYSVYSQNKAISVFSKTVGDKPSLGIRASSEAMPWGEINESSVDLMEDDEIAEEPSQTNAFLQVIRGAEPGFMRWDTIGMLSRFTHLFEKGDEALETLLEKAIEFQNNILEGKREPTVNGWTLGVPMPDLLQDVGNSEPEEIQKLQKAWKALRQSIPLGNVPTWHRFDLTVVCAEIDGNFILHHPLVANDRKAKRIRFFSLTRSPVKIVNRLYKYQDKGFILEPSELLKVVKMAASLTPEEALNLDSAIESLMDPELSSGDIRKSLLEFSDDYNRDVESIEALRENFLKLLRVVPSLVYGTDVIVQTIKKMGASDIELGKTSINYFL